VIQQRFKIGKQENVNSLTKRFSNLMFKGKINASLNLLANENSTGVFSINDALLNSLKAKHPDVNAKFRNSTSIFCKIYEKNNFSLPLP